MTMTLPPNRFAMIDTSYAPAPPVVTMPQLEGPWDIARLNEPVLPTLIKTVIVLSSAALSAFHGTRRNGGSIFWGVTWFGLGAVFPVITPALAAAQGFGQCKNNCPVDRTVHLSGARRRRR